MIAVRMGDHPSNLRQLILIRIIFFQEFQQGFHILQMIALIRKSIAAVIRVFWRSIVFGHAVGIAAIDHDKAAICQLYHHTQDAIGALDDGHGGRNNRLVILLFVRQQPIAAAVDDLESTVIQISEVVQVDHHQTLCVGHKVAIMFRSGVGDGAVIIFCPASLCQRFNIRIDLFTGNICISVLIVAIASVDRLLAVISKAGNDLCLGAVNTGITPGNSARVVIHGACAHLGYQLDIVVAFDADIEFSNQTGSDTLGVIQRIPIFAAGLLTQDFKSDIPGIILGIGNIAVGSAGNRVEVVRIQTSDIIDDVPASFAANLGRMNAQAFGKLGAVDTQCNFGLVISNTLIAGIRKCPIAIFIRILMTGDLLTCALCSAKNEQSVIVVLVDIDNKFAGRTVLQAGQAFHHQIAVEQVRQIPLALDAAGQLTGQGAAIADRTIVAQCATAIVTLVVIIRICVLANSFAAVVTNVIRLGIVGVLVTFMRVICLNIIALVSVTTDRAGIVGISSFVTRLDHFGNVVMISILVTASIAVMILVVVSMCTGVDASICPCNATGRMRQAITAHLHHKFQVVVASNIHVKLSCVVMVDICRRSQ